MVQKRFRESLSEMAGEAVVSEALGSFDVVGNIAVVKLPEALLPYKWTVAKALISTNRHIRTVLLQTSAVSSNSP